MFSFENLQKQVLVFNSSIRW